MRDLGVELAGGAEAQHGLVTGLRFERGGDLLGGFGEVGGDRDIRLRRESVASTPAARCGAEGERQIWQISSLTPGSAPAPLGIRSDLVSQRAACRDRALVRSLLTAMHGLVSLSAAANSARPVAGSDNGVFNWIGHRAPFIQHSGATVVPLVVGASIKTSICRIGRPMPTVASRAELEQLLADDVPYGDLTTDALGIGAA